MIRKLATDGLITSGYGHVELLDIPRLQEILGGDLFPQPAP